MPTNLNRSAWGVTEAEYPRLATAAAQLRFMLRYAVLAPSNHNSQPWMFRVRGNAVELYANRARSLHVTDPEDRPLLISCGGALFHLRVAIWHFGNLDRTHLLSTPGDAARPLKVDLIIISRHGGARAAACAPRCFEGGSGNQLEQGFRMAVPSVSSVNDDSFLQRGDRWVVAQSALLVAVVLLAPLFPWEWQHPGTIPVGIALFALGGWVGLAGVRALGRNRTACPQPLADSVLVQSGIYARVRHPLYSSLMFASVGWAVGWASWAGLVAAGALTLLLHAKATREEHWLHERYPAYRDYARRVNRFLPWA